MFPFTLKVADFGQATREETSTVSGIFPIYFCNILMYYPEDMWYQELYGTGDHNPTQLRQTRGFVWHWRSPPGYVSHR